MISTLLLALTGLEIMVRIGYTLVLVSVIIGGAVIKYLAEIKASSKKTETDFHSFKNDFNIEISNLKNQVERVNDKIKDSFSKSETNNLLLQLENKIQSKIYDLFNTYQQKLNNKNNTTKD
jgi:glutamine synthetase type III